MRFGERTADLIRRFPTLRRVFLPVFNAALAKAKAWDESFPGGADVPLGQSRQVQAAMKKHQEFELKLQAEADRVLRSQVGAHLQRLGYTANESLVLEIAGRLLQRFNENALLTAKMDEIRQLPQGPESRRLRLSMLRKVTQQFLPGVLVEEFPRAKLPELSTGVNERPWWFRRRYLMAFDQSAGVLTLDPDEVETSPAATALDPSEVEDAPSQSVSSSAQPLPTPETAGGGSRYEANIPNPFPRPP